MLYKIHIINNHKCKYFILFRHEGTNHPGDPGLYFHEFLLFIGRVAW